MLKTSYRKVIYFICSLSLLLACLLSSVQFWAFNESFYHDQHSKLTLYGKSIAEHIGISNDDLDELTSFTLDYLKSFDTSLDKKMIVNGVEGEVFTDEEKLHMVDVRKLNICSVYVMYIAIVLFIVSIVYIFRHKLFDEFFVFNKKFLISLAIIFGFLIVWILIDFDSFWNSFHHVFFAGNDLWILDLRKDILIMIVPPEFFNNLVLYIVSNFVILYVLINISFMFIRKRLND